MKGFVQNTSGLALDNADFRRVLYTAKNCQLVLIALKPKEEMAGVRTAIRPGFAVLVPAGRSTASSTRAAFL